MNENKKKLSHKAKEILEELERDRIKDEDKKNTEKKQQEIVLNVATIFNNNIKIWFLISVLSFFLFNYSYFKSGTLFSFANILNQVYLLIYLIVLFYSISSYIYVKRNFNHNANNEDEIFDNVILNRIKKVVLNIFVLEFIIMIFYIFNLFL